MVTPLAPSVSGNDAVTRSGSAFNTASYDGAVSASRLTPALADSKDGRIGSVQPAVPTTRSATPSDSSISVLPWLRETMRSGGRSTVTVRPQSSRETG